MIIGLGYQARSGKDTVASYLEDHHSFLKIAFADALKEGAKAVFSLTDDQVYGDLKETKDPFWKDTPRNILQKMGTECMRGGYRDDIWIKCVERVVCHADSDNWVISDVRFPNEAQAIKDWGGYLVRIDRPMSDDFAKVATKLHASEVSLLEYKGWDHIIENNKGLEELREKTAAMVSKITARSALPHAPTADTASSTTSGVRSTAKGAMSP